ncbi:MAG: hypothetical protein RSE97_07820, partial [Oscillospiraceae bacterium]
ATMSASPSKPSKKPWNFTFALSFSYKKIHQKTTPHFTRAKWGVCLKILPELGAGGFCFDISMEK